MKAKKYCQEEWSNSLIILLMLKEISSNKHREKKKILTVAYPDLRGTGKGAKIRGGTGLTPGPLP